MSDVIYEEIPRPSHEVLWSLWRKVAEYEGPEFDDHFRYAIWWLLHRLDDTPHGGVMKEDEALEKIRRYRTISVPLVAIRLQVSEKEVLAQSAMPADEFHNAWLQVRRWVVGDEPIF